MKPRVTSFAPQFLVADLERSIAYYQKIGFTFGEPWEGFYAIGVLDGLELHLKEAPKNDADRQHRHDFRNVWRSWSRGRRFRLHAGTRNQSVVLSGNTFDVASELRQNLVDLRFGKSYSIDKTRTRS